MKLKVTKKINSELVITLLLLIVMSIFTAWECSTIPSMDQMVGENQSDQLEISQTKQPYKINKGATDKVRISTIQYIREKTEEYSRDMTNTKIVAVAINIMVMLIVISLLISPQKSKSVCEFMANIGKMTEDDLFSKHIIYESYDKSSKKK